MKKTASLILCVVFLMLTACADVYSSYPEALTSAAPETVTEMTFGTSAELSETSSEPKKPEFIKAELMNYKDGQLTLELDGTEQTYEVWDNVFEPLGGVGAAKAVINNRYNEKIPAAIKLNPEKTRIVSCKLMLDEFNEELNDPEYEKLPMEDRILKMEKISNTKLRVYNKLDSIELDTRDLETVFQGKYPEKSDDAGVIGYILPSGRFFPVLITYYVGTCEEYGYIDKKYCQPDILSYPIFFGTVQYLAEDRAVVLLTDGKTTLDVPTWFRDSEVKEQQEVMVVLDTDTTLFGSGEQYKSDYAVFYTEPQKKLPEKYPDIQALAYAKVDMTDTRKLAVTAIADLEVTAEAPEKRG